MGVPKLKQKQGQEQKRQDARILLPAVRSVLSTQQPRRVDWDTQRTHLLPSLPVFAALTSATPCSGAPFHSDFTSPKQELVTDVFSLPCHLTLHEFQSDQEGQVHHWHLWDPVRRTKKEKKTSHSLGSARKPCLSWHPQSSPVSIIHSKRSVVLDLLSPFFPQDHTGWGCPDRGEIKVSLRRSNSNPSFANKY